MSTPQKIEQEKKRKEALRLKHERELARQEEARLFKERTEELEERRGMQEADTRGHEVLRLAKLQAESKEKLDLEKAETAKVLLPTVTERLTRWKEKKRVASEWDKYIAKAGPAAAGSIGQISPERLSELNTFLTMWGEEWKQRKGTPGVMQAMDLAKAAGEVLEDLEMMEEDRGDGERSAAIKDFLIARVDETTADVVHHADMHMKEGSELCVLQGGVENVLKLGIWVTFGISMTTAGNPGQVQFSDIGLGSDIPSHLALKGSALRMLYLQFGLHKPINEEEGGVFAYGGELLYDMLQMPPAPRKVKSWTMRQVTQHAKTITKVPYVPHVTQTAPPPQATTTPASKALAPVTTTATTAPSGALTSAQEAAQAEAAGLLGVHLKVPANVMVRSPVMVAVWKEDEKRWDTTGIINVLYDPHLREVQFHTPFTGSFALVHSLTADLPYEYWEITTSPSNPTSVTTAALRVVTKSGLTVVVEVCDDLCRLVEPVCPELEYLRATKLPASLFLKKLAHSGIKLTPTSTTATKPLTEEEKEVYRQMGTVVPHIKLSWSRWNAAAGLSAFHSFAFSALLGAEERTILAHPHGYSAIMSPPTNPASVSLTTPSIDNDSSTTETTEVRQEGKQKINTEVLTGRENHADLYHCVLKDPEVPEAVKQNITSKHIQLHFSAELSSLLSLIRPLSFSQ